MWSIIRLSKWNENIVEENLNIILLSKAYGKDIFVQSCKNLKDDIELFECDDKDMLKKIKENDCHSILFLNIPRFFLIIFFFF